MKRTVELEFKTQKSKYEKIRIFNARNAWLRMAMRGKREQSLTILLLSSHTIL
jgi:hypothetical protein